LVLSPALFREVDLAVIHDFGEWVSRIGWA
jgi:hypothetical protein